MLAYSTYSEAGGVGKTTTAANLAVAHARAGLKPLVIPLDPQEGNSRGCSGSTTIAPPTLTRSPII